jgi:hypothetical protein
MRSIVVGEEVGGVFDQSMKSRLMIRLIKGST